MTLRSLFECSCLTRKQTAGELGVSQELKIHQVRSQVRSVEIERRSLVDWIRMPRGHANLSMILKISIRGQKCDRV